MNTVRLSNIALGDFRQFLFDQGCSRTQAVLKVVADMRSGRGKG